MTAFDSFVTSNFDALTFGLFFTCLFVLGALEFWMSRTPQMAARRRRWPANIWLTLLNLAVISVLPVTGVTAAHWADATGFGLMNAAELPFVAALCAGFAARSLISYAIHVAMHKIPILWRLHRIHHTDTELDVSTTVRFHPLEFVVSVPLVVVTIAGFGIPVLVVMLYELFDAVMAVASHANLRLPARLERAAQTLLVTPAMHRVHHSSDPAETDSNYGATLSVWDRAFGTYTVRADDDLDRMRLGLAECQDERPTSLPWLLALPFATLKRIGPRRSA